MSRVARELRLEIVAIFLSLIGLVFVMGALTFAGSLVLGQLLAKGWPVARGIRMGPRELILSLSAMMVPGLALVGAAWGLQRLLREE